MELNIHKAFRNGTKTHYKKYIYVYICLKWLILLVQFKWWGDDKIDSLGMLKEFVYDDTDDTYFSNNMPVFT